MSVSSILLSPFNTQNQYTAAVDVEIFHSESKHAYFVKVTGDRIILESFHGNQEQYEKLQNIFGQVVTKRDEHQGMKKIYQNPENMKLYGAGKTFTDEEIPKRIENNANRFLTDDPFGRFKIIDKVSQEIIGFTALGHGYVAGESQASLILDKSKVNQKYGQETAVLIGALALAYLRKEFKVGEVNDKKPVSSFTATAREDNEISKQFLAKLGLVKIRELTENERLSNQPTYLYGIGADKVKEKVIELMDITKLKIQYSEGF